MFFFETICRFLIRECSSFSFLFPFVIDMFEMNLINYSMSNLFYVFGRKIIYDPIILVMNDTV